MTKTRFLQGITLCLSLMAIGSQAHAADTYNQAEVIPVMQDYQAGDNHFLEASDVVDNTDVTPVVIGTEWEAGDSQVDPSLADDQTEQASDPITIGAEWEAGDAH